MGSEQGIYLWHNLRVGDVFPSSPFSPYISGGSLSRVVRPLEDKVIWSVPYGRLSHSHAIETRGGDKRNVTVWRLEPTLFLLGAVIQR